MNLELHDLPYLSLVQCQDDIRAVLSATPRSIMLHTGSVVLMAQLDQITALPVTDTALAALGFEETDADQWTFTPPEPFTPRDEVSTMTVALYGDGTCLCDFNMDEEGLFVTRVFYDKCQYVHELQQLIWRHFRHWPLPAHFRHLT